MPSRITAPAASETSSAVLDHRQIRASCSSPSLGAPVSLSRSVCRHRSPPQFPLRFIAAISAMVSPLLPTDAAPIGHTRTLPAGFGAIHNEARHRRIVVHRLRVRHAAHRGKSAPRRGARPCFDSLGIFLPGFAQVHMQIDKSRRDNQSAGIKNFQAVARLPIAACRSFSRAATNLCILSPSSKTSSAASVFVAGSSTRPFLISSMRGILYSFRSVDLRLRASFDCAGECAPAGVCDDPSSIGSASLRRSAHQQKEQRHAHRDPVSHLFEHAGLRAVGHLRRDLQAAIHRPGMQHDRVWLRVPQPLGVQLIQQNIFFGESDGSYIRSFCTRSTRTTSASSSASSIAKHAPQLRPAAPSFSNSRGTHIAGPHSVNLQPNFPSR